MLWKCTDKINGEKEEYYKNSRNQTKPVSKKPVSLEDPWVSKQACLRTLENTNFMEAILQSNKNGT